MNLPTRNPQSPTFRQRTLIAAALTLAITIAGPAFARDNALETDLAYRSPYAMVDPAAAATASPIAEPIQPETLSPVADLQPGEFLWTPEISPAGPVVIVVSLPQQRAHVYRNGTRIGVSTISSGKSGHETPTGVFPILQKRAEHYSNLYDGAPMPYMQRLTWDGIALHAGRIPGKPASHGCIRLPLAFAKILFAATERGVTVVVADENSHGRSVVWPSETAPVDAYTGLEPGNSQQPAPPVYASDTMAALE